MTETVYDQNVQMYVDFVDRVLAAEPSLFGEMLAVFKRLLGSQLDGATVCDVACGEGYLSRYLARLGPREVIGVDLSSALIDVALQRRDASNLSFRVDDAQKLGSLSDGLVDIVVSQMALMDVADHVAMFTAVRRVLKTGAPFAFSLLHPCFEGPYHLPDEPQFLIDEAGQPTACVVRHYASEGYWRSDGSGVRGHVGSYHRMLSTYLNDLVRCGFVLDHLVEPVFDVPGLGSQVPRVMIILAHAS